MNLFKKVDLGLFNTSAWLTIIITYILPFRSNIDGIRTYGYPFVFLTSFGDNTSNTPLMSMAINPIVLMLNAVIVYILLACILTVIVRIKKQKAENR